MKVRLGPGRRLSRIALKRTISIALLTLPAMRASAQGRTVPIPNHGFQERCAKALSAENHAFPFAGRTFTFAAASRTAALGGTYSASELSTQTLPSTALTVFSACPKTAPGATSYSVPTSLLHLSALQADSRSTLGNRPGDDSKNQLSREPADFNRSIYYKNRLEFSLESGWLPNNIPFVFPLLMGEVEKFIDLHYRLAPFIASIRWQLNSVGGRSFLRGNWDLTFGGALTMIPRGPETRYWAFISGFRRNFVQPNWRIVPYLEGRAGLGNIDAKGPYGVAHAQGQDFTFTVMLGIGARYNFNSRYAISTGVGYTHISNLYLSEPEYVDDAINVYGPTVGIHIRLGKPRR